MSKPLLIEIASDVVCPWCYIGKRRLEKALESLAKLGQAGPTDVLVTSNHGWLRGSGRARRAQVSR